MSSATRFRVLIVDDEPLAREGVRELLEGKPGLHVIGESADGVQAVDDILRLTPDLVFLDVQIPELDGFGVVSTVGVENMPAVIFVTAYDEFAVRAFDIHALDYLLKPIDPARFDLALDRARSVLELREPGALQRKLLELLRDVQGESHYLERMAVRSHGKISFLRTAEIDWIQADGDYVCVNIAGRKHLVREKISELENKLHPKRFARIHRSTIVNIDRIMELQPLFHGEYAVTLRNGVKLTLSRSYRDRTLTLLNQVP